ncbi:MAG TPA: PH domain-containing protein [Caldilineaceae bacterium]|nr:PH domain-containing protein [Caldilineaceae bacterium]
MQRDEVRRIVNQQFFQSLAESGTQIHALPQDQLQAIVGAMADSVFAAIAAVEEEDFNAPAGRSAAMPTYSEGAMEEVEEVQIWRGRPYMTVGTIYELTTQRIRVIKGILGNRIEEVELVRVRDTKYKQHLGERMLDVGDITVISNDPTTPELTLHNVKNPIEVREMIRKATIDEKNRRGLRYREEM